MPVSAKLTIAIVGGLTAGSVVWLWTNWGGDVVLAYAAGVAMNCF